MLFYKYLFRVAHLEVMRKKRWKRSKSTEDESGDDEATEDEEEQGQQRQEKPKKPVNSFLQFRNSFQNSVSSSTGLVAASREAGVAWNTMNEEEKKPYVELYRKDEDRYRRELLEHEAANNKKGTHKNIFRLPTSLPRITHLSFYSVPMHVAYLCC